MRQLFGNIARFFQSLFHGHPATTIPIPHSTPTPTIFPLLQKSDASLSQLPATGPSEWMWLLLALCVVTGIIMLLRARVTHA